MQTVHCSPGLVWFSQFIQYVQPTAVKCIAMKVVCSVLCNRVNGRKGAGGGVTKNNLGHLRAHNMQWWEVCSVQWKSGETVFSTKTAACMQCCLHTPVHTSVGFRGDILTAGQVHIQLVCVRSSLAEVKSVQLDECNAEVCVPVSQEAHTLPISGVQFPVECADVCEFGWGWRAHGVWGEHTSTRCLSQRRRRQLSSHSRRAAHCTLQRTPVLFLDGYQDKF